MTRTRSNDPRRRAASQWWLAALVACAAGAALIAWLAQTRMPSQPLSPMTVWAVDDCRKVRPGVRPEPAKTSVNISAARGELAAFQVIVSAHGPPLKGVDVTASPLTGPAGSIPSAAVALYREAMYTVVTPSLIHPRGGERGLWPDALVPIGTDRYWRERRNGAPFGVPADTSQPVWVEVRVPDDAKPGDYTGTVRVADSGGHKGRATVRLRVWDFAMPRTSSLPTSFGIGTGSRVRHHLDPAGTDALARLYAREALRNRVSLWGMWFLNGQPYYDYDPLHPERGATMSDWSRYDDLYGEAMRGTPEGTATTIDVPPQTVLRSELPAPVLQPPVVSRGGSLPAGRYVYRVSAFSGEGETEGSVVQAVTAAAGSRVTLSWSAAVNARWSSLNARRYSVYRARNAKQPVNDNPATYLVATATGTRFVDDGSKAEQRGAPCPNANSTGDREALAVFRAYAAHFREKGWLSRAYLYAEDEPFTSKHLEQARKQALLWRRAVPGGWSLVTNVYSPVLEGAVNLWCVVLNWFDDGEHGRAGDVAKRHARGEKVWWYQGMMSRGDPAHRGGSWPSYFIDDTAMSSRITGFFTWRYGFDGILYYMMDMAYREGNDPWRSQFYFGANGDGTLFYPGTPDRIGGKHDIPVTSLRLALIRQGLQDYEYLKRMADLGDKPFADRQAARLVSAPDRFVNDGDAALVQSVRRELGARIEELQRAR